MFGQRVEVLIFVNQGNKLLRRLSALLVAGDTLFQLRDLTRQCLLLLGVLRIQNGIPLVRQLAQGVVLRELLSRVSLKK